MKRSGAIWLVVGVVAVAALLMYFVVLPQIRDGKAVNDIAKRADQAVKEVQQAVNDAGKQVEEIAKGADEAKTVVLAKMARLGVEAGKAVDDMQALLDKGTPTDEQFTAAKAKLAAALKEASELKLPADADGIVLTAVAKMSAAARTALAAVEDLPRDPAAAKAVLADMKAKFLAALPGGASEPPAEAAKPATSDDGASVIPPIEGQQKPDAVTDASRPNEEDRAATPAFDILRVEKDGSTVIAGRAEPGAKVEIVDGDRVIAAAETDPTGDFAAVLDNPLPSGDHSITLKATSKDGKTMASEEVATVSVPKDASGELLAMVTRPGEASKIITAPEGQNAQVGSDNKAEQSAAEEPANAAATETKIPALPSQSSDIALTPPVVPEGSKDKSQHQEIANADPAVSRTSVPSTDSAAQADAAGAPEVLVSAVELEGDKIFVAGNARPGAAIRIYADDQVVADAVADANGRFVAEGVIKLTVGSHTIRADVLSADGSKVEFRASVPFFRPEGDLAAVASADSSAPAIEPLANGVFDKARNEAGKAMALLKGLYANGKTPTAEELAAARSSAEIALKSLADVRVSAGVDPAVADLASKASSEAAKALDRLKAVPADATAFKSALGEFEAIVASALKHGRQSPGLDTGATVSADAAATDHAEPMEQAAASQLVEKSDGQISAKDVQVTTKVDRLAQAPKAEPQAQKSTASKPAADQTVEPSESGDAQTAASADQPKVIEQAPLKQSASSVIIRRGDTLWQISRRVYGKGIRYTTIYLANQSQIDNPDRILPGQVFTTPGKWLDNAEELHKKRLQHRD